MQELIKQIIADTVARAKGATAYREPLVGFARADDPLFKELKKAVGPGHLLPGDILPGATSVVAFFVPFTRELVKLNRKHPYVAREWAVAYIETNRLISLCCQRLVDELTNRGIKAAWQKPTHNFDPELLISHWSHKHVAYICGLGTFGLHHMLITPRGCAGRVGSLVMDLPLEASRRPDVENCLYKRAGKCLACVKICPAGALSQQGLDKKLCYLRLLEVDTHYKDLDVCDVCGKCATGGPCSLTG